MSLENEKTARVYQNRAENRCAYRNCNNRRGDNGVILFCFPNKAKKAEKYDKWFHNSGIKKENTSWRLMICNSHFNGEDYTTYEHQKLLPRAIPIDYRLVDKDVHHPFDPTKAEKVYTNNMSRNFLNFIKTEIITEENDGESEKCEEITTFDRTKLKRVYGSNSPHVMKISKKNEEDDDESDNENKDSHESVKSVNINNSCVKIDVIKTEIIIDESERENTILPE